MTPRAKKMLFIIYAVLVILSPSLLFRYLVNSGSTDEQASVLASGLFAYFIGMPLVAISGLITTLIVLNRRSSRAYLKAILGFAIPAIIVLTIIAV